MRYRLTAFALLLGLSGLAAAGTHWGYDGKEGPEHWAGLSADYAMCGMGKNQSPIDVARSFSAQLPALMLNYHAGGNEVLNNGHTIKVDFQPGSAFSVDGHSYALKQLHFHSPSENTINGRHFPMEMHLVHADENGALAVIGVMFTYGQANAALKNIFRQMPTAAGGKTMLEKHVDASALLPKDTAYYAFSGSLTTPPCSEGVSWFLLKEPITASKLQIRAFMELMGHPNNRPVQPLNARMVVGN